ncbi:MAG: hypothetical protein HRT71_18530 [Flavobacteriales bacterium]|nr:hypothetical protein [Flavobacteriales bacterium]
MNKKTVKIVRIGVVSLIITSCIIIVILAWLAFGPIYSSGSIEVNSHVIEYDEKYLGDFSGSNYYVSFLYNDRIVVFQPLN